MAGSAQAIRDLGGILPILALWGAAVIVLAIAALVRRGASARVPGVLSLLGILLAISFLVRRPEAGFGTPMFANSLLSDTLSSSSALILLLSGLLSVLVAQTYLRRLLLEMPEYYALLLLSLSGAYLMLLANDLLVLFIGLELMSFGFYVLAGFAKQDARSDEAAVKYFLTGAFASAFMVFGIMLMYGASGSTEFTHIQSAVARGALRTPMGIGAVAMLTVGFAFKVSAVPFHQWAPDVYEGAPTSATAFLAATAKVGAFAAMLRVFDALAGGSAGWLPALRVLAIVTMIGGNLVAIAQTNVKRMLGYSAIAHAGYLLVCVVCVGMRYMGTQGAQANMLAMTATVFYLLAYALATLGAFGVLAYVSTSGRDVQTLDQIRGLVRVDAPAAYAMVIFMLSLAGIPATAGFIGKWQIFYSAVTGGDITLAVVVALTSVLGAFFYLRVVWYMLFEEGPPTLTAATADRTEAGVAVFVAAFLTVLLGIVPGVLLGYLSVVR